MFTRTSLTLAASLVLATSACKSEAEQAVEKAAEAQVAAARAAEAAAVAAGKAAEAARAAGQAAGEATEEGAENAAQGLEQALAQAQKAMAANAANVDPVDFRELKALLPESAAGLTRKKANGQKNAAMGFKMSMAEGDYEGDGGKLEIKLIDMGTMKGFAQMAAASWLAVEMDREDDDGYEKTTTFQGYKAYEKWNGKSKRGELKTIVGNRFIVEVTGRGVPMDKIKSAAKELDLAKLDGMKNVGVQ